MIHINYIAVIVTTIISIILGSVWYGPLFGKQWMALANISPEKMAEGKKNMPWTYVLAIIASFLSSVVLAKGIILAGLYLSTNGLGQPGIFVGIWTALCVWLGFFATTSLSGVLWEGRPWKLWLLNNAYYIVNLLIAGIILSVWR